MRTHTNNIIVSEILVLSKHLAGFSLENSSGAELLRHFTFRPTTNVVCLE